MSKEKLNRIRKDWEEHLGFNCDMKSLGSYIKIHEQYGVTSSDMLWLLTELDAVISDRDSYKRGFHNATDRIEELQKELREYKI